MTWLVTGGSGFLGRHLLDALAVEPEIRPVALGRRLPFGWPADRFRRADLDDGKAVESAVADLQPDVVIHLAGRTPPAAPELLHRANVGGTARLLAALRRLARPVRVVLGGSAAELGPVPIADLPAGEDLPCRPADAYGLSKWAAARLGLSTAPPLEVIAARIFNPIGPGMPASQALGRFAAELASGADHLRVGDIDARRDFVDVRDVASALIALARSGRAGAIYHIGTGESHAIGDGLDRLIGLCGRPVHVEVIAELSRRGPADSRANISRIVGDTGWSPRLSFERSLTDLWADSKRRLLPGRHVA